MKERLNDWTQRIGGKLGKKVIELTGDVTPDMRAIERSDVIITTPEKWDGISRGWKTRGYVKLVRVIIIDEVIMKKKKNNCLFLFYFIINSLFTLAFWCLCVCVVCCFARCVLF